MRRKHGSSCVPRAQLYDRDAVIEDYGVEPGSYEVKPLPKLKVYQVRARATHSTPLVR